MDVLEIKNDLLRLVVETNDAAQLDMVRNYFKILKKETKPTVEIDAQEKRMIEIGLKQIEEGKVISNTEARQRIKKFLQSKSA
ncbi:MAG: hypothetical protein AAGG68_08490 [Bacteroidota bacterium]